MTAPVNVPTRLHLSALYAGTLRLMADRDQEFDDIEAARAATAEVFDYQFSRWASGAQALALLPELARATPDAVDELFRSTLTSHGYPVPDPIPLVEWLDGDHHTTVIQDTIHHNPDLAEHLANAARRISLDFVTRIVCRSVTV